jgi:hypothetical protein
MCSLGAVWLILFIAMFCGAKVNPRLEVLVTVACACWFAYWTVSVINSALKKKEKVLMMPVDNPVIVTKLTKPEETKPNETKETTPKSE